MAIYDLQNPQYLENDFNDIYTRLCQIYEINIANNQIQISSKIADTSNTYWASEENSQQFNSHIPTFKSLHKDMYSFIEAIAIMNFEIYDYKYFEEKYENYEEFRLLNNMIKHPKKKDVEINFTKINHFAGIHFDLMCNFKYPDTFKCVAYPSFVILFLTILKDFHVIKLTD